MLFKNREQIDTAEFWDNLDKKNRNKMIIISVIAFLSVVTAIFFITKPQYQPLFSSKLDPKDVGDITAELDKQGIVYKISDSGTTVEVKKQDFNKAKVLLAQAGYPKSGVTFEDLNKTSLGTTDEERRRKYQIYKESDLAKALTENIENIKNAVVKLSIPEKTNFFKKEEEKPTASVIVESYEELTASQIKAIQKFIAGSIEGLEPKDVTILDNKGNELSTEEENDIYANADKQYASKILQERDAEKKVKNLLSGLADNVQVTANLVLDFDTKVSSKELYEPVLDDQGIIISREVRKENLTNGTAGGVPGTDANPPTYPNVNTGENGNYEMSDVKENYGVNKIIQEESKSVGKPDYAASSMSIVMYFSKKQGEEAQNNGVDIEQIKNIASSATGIPTENVSVEVFDIQEALSEAETKFDLMKTLGYVGPIVLVFVLIGLIAFLMFRNRKEVMEEAEVPMMPINSVVHEVEEEKLPEIDLEEKSEVKKQIDKLVKQKPDAVAQLLRNWLSDDWD